MVTEEKIYKVCPRCGKITPEGFGDTTNESRRVAIKVCPACFEKQQSLVWNSICPPAFLRTDPHKLPNQDATRKAMAQIIGRLGLMLHGPTRTGKSRTAWMILKNCVMQGVSVKSVGSMDLGVDLAAKFSSDPILAAETVRQWCKVGVLLLDDAFKVKLTERVEQVIFTVIDERTQNEKPIVVTTNDSPQTLVLRMSTDRGPALVARLWEFCQTVSFS